MEVQGNFLIEDAPNSFYQAARLVVGLAALNDFLDGCSGGDRKRRLVDDLIPRVQFRHDEMHRRTVRQHAMPECIFVGTGTRK